MTVRELHIGVNQGLQQIAANRTRKFLSPEIDWILNLVQNRFIQSKLKPSFDKTGTPTGGFEVSQLDADAIRTIIVAAYSMTPYIDPGNRRYKCFLPPDYSYLLSDWSFTKLLCTTDTPIVATDTLYINALRQEYSNKTSPNYYQSMIMQLGDNYIQIPAVFPYGNTYSGYQQKEDISFLIPWIARSYGFYWERFGDQKALPGYYINVTTAPQPSIILNIDNVGTSFSTQTKTLSLQKHTNPGKYYDNRLSATSKIAGMNSTEFIKTSYYSPISELANGILYIYNDESFTVNEVGISYIRKPLPISLSLNQSSELPEEFHQNLIDLTVEYMKGILENQAGYALKKDDNQSRVVL